MLSQQEFPDKVAYFYLPFYYIKNLRIAAKLEITLIRGV